MSAGRPGGWDVVDLDDDPTPGEVSGIRSLSRGYGSIAEAAGEAHRILVRILTDGATASWVGAAGDAFRAKVDDDFPGQVDKCASSYGLARDALAGFAGRVDDAQVKADTNLAKAKSAAEDLASAKDAVAQATGGASGAAQTFQEQQDLYDRYKHQDPPAGVQVPSAAQLRSLSAASQAAQAQANQAQGDLSDAQSRLDAAKRMVLEAQGDYQDAEDRAVRTLEDAYDAAVPEDSWWVKVLHSKAWHVIVAVVTVLVIVAAIAAFFVTGPLALILAAVVAIGSGLQFLDDAGKYFNGEESGAEFAMALALTFLPGGKIAKGLEKGLAAATKGIRAGEDVAKAAKEVGDGGGKKVFDRFGNEVDENKDPKWLQHKLKDRENMPAWKRKIFEGVEFNHQHYDRYEHREVTVEGRKRVDSYTHEVEIVSRKHTDLGQPDGVSTATAKKYIDEAVKKYSPNSPITSGPLKGQKLGGDLILEVQPKQGAIPQEVLDYAEDVGVRIRDTNGKPYNFLDGP